MRRVLAVVAAIVLGLGVAARAGITLDTVAVGNPGNVGDTWAMATDGTTGYGSVSYTYCIGKCEVTAAQYAAFLNAVAKTDTYALYNTWMGNIYGCGIQRTGIPGSYSYTVASAYANRPVNYVSYWDACRFTNWLHNGQGTGAQDATTTERGAYTLDGYTGTDGRTIQRSADWTWAVTSEDEWYKAAYYKGGGTNAGYWLYPTQSDSAPGRDLSDASGNNANYYSMSGLFPIQYPYYTTTAGEFQNSDGAYGTFDQGGNVWEWNEAIRQVSDAYASRGLRGSSFQDFEAFLKSTYPNKSDPGFEDRKIGFRVVQAVPEPSSAFALLGGLTGLIGLRRRRA